MDYVVNLTMSLPIAKKTSLLHLVSLNDQVVPAEENTSLAERYKKLGGKIEIIS